MKLGVVSVDGTKIDANGSKHRSVRYDRVGELVAQLKLEISALMARSLGVGWQWRRRSSGLAEGARAQAGALR